MKTVLIGVFLFVLFFGILGNFTMRWSKRYRKFACKMGWHSYPDFCGSDEVDPTGFLHFAKCKWCGFKGQIDSQGNLF